MTPAVDPLYEEMHDALFRIVRQSILGFAIGHDAIVFARSVIRRADPDRYAALLKRRKDAGLPTAEDVETDGVEDTLP